MFQTFYCITHNKSTSLPARCFCTWPLFVSVWVARPSSSCTFTSSSVTTSYMLGQTLKRQEEQNVMTSQRVWWNTSPDNSLVTWLGVKRIIQSVCELQALRWKPYPQMTVNTLNKPHPETLFPSLSSFKLDWGDGVNSPVIWRGKMKFFMEIKEAAFLSKARCCVVDVFSGRDRARRTRTYRARRARRASRIIHIQNI